MRLVGIVGLDGARRSDGRQRYRRLVDILETPSLFTISQAERELAEAVGMGLPVEFVFREDLKPAMRARMERDFVPLDGCAAELQADESC